VKGPAAQTGHMCTLAPVGKSRNIKMWKYRKWKRF
jgi:hypothetical protein